MKGLSRKLLIWALMGMCYYPLEGLWRIPTNGGWAHISMLFVGAICVAASAGILNQIPRYYKLAMVWQCLIGAVSILVVEFISGCVLNLWLGFGIWDYTGQAGNILGQICPLFGVLWFLLIPFIVWLEDTLSWVFYREGSLYTLGYIYKELFTLK